MRNQNSTKLLRLARCFARRDRPSFLSTFLIEWTPNDILPCMLTSLQAYKPWMTPASLSWWPCVLSMVRTPAYTPQILPITLYQETPRRFRTMHFQRCNCEITADAKESIESPQLQSPA